MSDQELANQLGTMCVFGVVMTGEPLVRYLATMSDSDKSSLLDDLALLKDEPFNKLVNTLLETSKGDDLGPLGQTDWKE